MRSSSHSASASLSAPMDINAVEEEDYVSEDADPAAALMAKVEAMVEHRLAALLQKKLGASGASAGRSKAAEKTSTVPGLKGQ